MYKYKGFSMAGDEETDLFNTICLSSFIRDIDSLCNVYKVFDIDTIPIYINTHDGKYSIKGITFDGADGSNGHISAEIELGKLHK